MCVLAVHDRGDLSFEPLHGEPVHVHAWRALVSAAERLGAPAPVLLVDPDRRDRALADVAAATGTRPADVRTADAASWRPPATADVLVHDPLCPLAPVDFLVEVAGGGPVVAAVGCRPVTDTVKTVEDGRIDVTVDRDGLLDVVTPARVPAAYHRGGPVPTGDMVVLLGWLRERGEVLLARAPSMARRVGDASSLVVLESVDELAGRVRSSSR